MTTQFDSRLVHRTALPASLLFCRIVLGTGLVLVGIHVAVGLTWRFRHTVRSELRPLFYVSSEWGLMTWMTIGVSALFGLLCIAAGRVERRRGWYGVGALFLFLSMDDATMLHERVGWMMEGTIGPSVVYAWIQVMGPIFAVLGLGSVVFLWRRFEGNGRSRRRMLLAFAAMGTALVLEVFERFFALEQITWRGFSIERYTIPLEEMLELVGPTLLVACVGLRLERRLGTAREPRGTDAVRPREAA